jgi:hypothetical protein
MTFAEFNLENEFYCACNRVGMMARSTKATQPTSRTNNQYWQPFDHAKLAGQQPYELRTDGQAVDGIAWMSMAIRR